MAHRLSLAAAAAAALLATAAAQSAPDIAILEAKVVGEPLQGACNKVAVTYANIGDQNLDKGLKAAIITYPQGTPFTNRAEKPFSIAGNLRPQQKVTATIDKVSILGLGAFTVQVVADPTNQAGEAFQTQQNNTHTFNVNAVGACRGAQPPGPAPTTACDFALKFTAPPPTPSLANIDANTAVTYKVEAKNQGTVQCPKVNVQMHRYTGSSASGYGSAVGGTSGSIRQVQALNPGATQNLEWVDNVPGGTYTYQVKPMSTWNDGDNSNHRPTKTVQAN